MHERIIKALNRTGGGSEFCTKIVTACRPGHGLTVTGVGPVKFPISARKAKELIAVAQPAKFGRREKTLSDLQVRDTWEIPRSKLKFDQPAWTQTLQDVLEQVRKNLGLPLSSRLKAVLHNLLIYEKGQHFKAHQDSEKVEDMVATLARISHKKRNCPADFSA